MHLWVENLVSCRLTTSNNKIDTPRKTETHQMVYSGTSLSQTPHANKFPSMWFTQLVLHFQCVWLPLNLTESWRTPELKVLTSGVLYTLPNHKTTTSDRSIIIECIGLHVAQKSRLQYSQNIPYVVPPLNLTP